MRHVMVHARDGRPPRGVRDLDADCDMELDPDFLVMAGQALTWRTCHIGPKLAAIPLTASCALVLAEGPGLSSWQHAFSRGLAHRMAGEITVASVASRLLGHAPDDDFELLTLALHELTLLLTDLARQARPLDEPRTDPGRIVADAATTHAALLGPLADQRIELREQTDFTIYTVTSTPAEGHSEALERCRIRVGLPWPARTATTLGKDLGLARWRSTMQANDQRLWCWVEDGTRLVTELWLRPHAVLT